MYPGIFDSTMADQIWSTATAMVPIAFALFTLYLLFKLIKSVMP